MEAIILAGGLGTRLRSVIADLPKAMAPVNGKPFLSYLLDGLVDAHLDEAILAVGYMREKIEQYFGDRYRSLRIRYSIETAPLGTGGAISKAMAIANSAVVLVANGDTYVDVDYRGMLAAHEREGSKLTVAVHAVPDAARYGSLDIDAGVIRGVFEKGRTGAGTINAGVYLASRDLFDGYRLPPAFSFETDFLVPHVGEITPRAYPAHGTFIDIGIPEDYARAQTLFPRPE